MKSSSGAHFIALDHVRALAAFMVFAHHFAHGYGGYPVPLDQPVQLFALSILDKGHTGVALFMTLSGYLFAKLLDGKAVRYGGFVWNRVLRLVPLLALVIFAVGVLKFARGQPMSDYLGLVAKGVVLPTLPNGGWSITAEFHYYLLLPLMLWLLSRSRFWLLAIVVAAAALRFVLFLERGEIQSLAYWTIIGRIDQFALGMVMYHFRRNIAGRDALATAAIGAFITFYWYFDLLPGAAPGSSSTSALWILVPTIEGLAYGIAIAWYDSSFSPSRSGVSKFISHIGEYSYSIYLLHFFVVFAAARFVHERVMDISSFYWAVAWSVPAFLLMMPVGYLSFRYLEMPFLRLRKPYIRTVDARTGAAREALVLVADTREGIRELAPIVRPVARLVCAETYEAALEACRTHRPDAIVVGYHFDGIRPQRLIHDVRERLPGAPIPMVLVRALGSRADVSAPAGSGADEYVDLAANVAQGEEKLRRGLRDRLAV